MSTLWFNPERNLLYELREDRLLYSGDDFFVVFTTYSGLSFFEFTPGLLKDLGYIKVGTV